MKKQQRIRHTMMSICTAAAMLLLAVACSRTENATPALSPDVQAQAGAPKSGSGFIGLLNSSSSVTFQICNTGGSQLLAGVNLGVLYGCPNTCKGNNQVCVSTGLSPSIYCFNMGQWYDIKATTGPASRQTLHIMFPLGYSACTLSPPFKVNYDNATGTWASAGGNLNGIQWSQSATHCP